MYSALVIDDYPTILVAIKSLLMQSPSFEKVFVASSSKQSLDILKHNSIDLVITDIELQGDDGFLLLKKIKRDFPDIKSLFFSSKNESIYSLRALEVKANGFISKDRELEEILFAAEHVLNGYLFFPSDILNSISGLATLGESDEPSHTLTAREISVLSYLIKGYKNKEIAQTLFISSKTVSTYKTRIMTKLGVKSVIDMANYAAKNNLL